MKKKKKDHPLISVVEGYSLKKNKFCQNPLSCLK